MYKDVSGSEDKVIDQALEHFIQGYINVNDCDAKASTVYESAMLAGHRIALDLIEHGKCDVIDSQKMNELFQHYASYKMTYERMMKVITELATIAKNELTTR